jgi:membrane-associated phospholipid phosphatase
VSSLALSVLFYRVLAIAGPLGELWLTLPFAAALIAWCIISSQYKGAFWVAAAVLGTTTSIVVLKLLSTLIGPPWQPHWKYISNLFPSGHAAMGTVVYGCLVICVRRAIPSLAKPCAAIVLAVMALLCIQRVADGIHPPLDVFGGVAIGGAALYVLCRLWPTGSLRPIGFPVVVVAAILILQSFYGQDIDSARMVMQAAMKVRAVVTDVEGLLGR